MIQTAQTDVAGPALNPVKALLRSWNHFWFEPVSTSTLAVVRMAFGLLTFIWTVTLLPDLRAFFTSRGILPTQPPGAWTWGILQHSSSMALVLVVFTMLVVGSIGMCLGFWTRLSSIVVFVGLMSIERRNPWVLNTGDWLLRILAFYLMLAPTGAALSMDRYRRHKETFWESPLRSPWALRLIQIQLTVVYLGSVWGKVQGTTWNNGTAVSYALRIGDFARIHVPTAIAANGVLTSIMTYGALATEFSIAILVWNRRARVYVLTAGVLMHLTIDATMLVGFFSYELFIAYLAFVPEDRLDIWLGHLGARFQRDREHGVESVNNHSYSEVVGPARSRSGL